MHSLAVTNGEVCTMPVFRPLIGFDKQGDRRYFRKSGTYETSVLPYEGLLHDLRCKASGDKTEPECHQMLRAPSGRRDRWMMERAVSTAETIEVC